MSYIALLLSLIVCLCKSLPCIPANTCFQVRTANTLSAFDIAQGVSTSLLDASTKFTCSAGTVSQQLYPGVNDCSGDFSTELEVTILSPGDGSNYNNMSLRVDYLQGQGCPTLTGNSEECQTFMLLKHRGHKYWEDANGDATQYGDIGTNCTDYLSNIATLTMYDTVAVPVGCVKNDLGSKLFECDANGWRFTHYTRDDCTGTSYAQQSEDYAVGKCGYRTEYLDISGEPCSGPAGGGCLLFANWYWYDLDCCPIAGKTCCGATAAGPTAYTNCVNTPFPTAPPTQPTAPTDTPTKAPSQSTKSPTTSVPSEPTTSEPTTSEPTTSVPTTSEPTTSVPTTSQPTTSEPTTSVPTKYPSTPPSKSPTNLPTTSPTFTEQRETTIYSTGNDYESNIAANQKGSNYGLYIAVIMIVICCI